jgi:hypothetical protein
LNGPRIKNKNMTSSSKKSKKCWRHYIAVMNLGIVIVLEHGGEAPGRKKEGKTVRKEKEWRINIRVVWLQASGENSRFFH